MQTVQSALEAYIDDPAVFFVFPTDIAASAWSDYALRLKKAVALERFTAWDKFKSEAVRAEKQDKNSIPSPLRTFCVAAFTPKCRKAFFFVACTGRIRFESRSVCGLAYIACALPCLMEAQVQ